MTITMMMITMMTVTIEDDDNASAADDGEDEDDYGEDVENYCNDNDDHLFKRLQSFQGHVMVGVECSSSVQGVTSRFSSAGTTTFKCICSRGSTIGWGNDDGDNAMTKTDTNKRFTHWGRRRVSSSRRRRYPGVLPKITCEMHYWECPAE